MRVPLDARCSLYQLKPRAKDTGIYTCANCRYCKNQRQTIRGTRVGECTKKEEER